jgi:putative resolvase
MCALVSKYVCYEHNIVQRESGCLSGRQHQDAAALGSEARAHGRRNYSKAMLDAFMHRAPPSTARIPIVYCRAWSAAQKPDLKNQRRVLEDFCAARGVAGVQFVEEIGGGLNLKRPKFVALMDQHRSAAGIAAQGPASSLWLSFEHFCAEHGAELLVRNNKHLSPEQEMVQDLVAIGHCFSARLATIARKLKEALAQVISK